jgi:hypothetical protein
MGSADAIDRGAARLEAGARILRVGSGRTMPDGID